MREPLFILRSKQVPDWYIAEQAGSWGRMGTKQEAMQKPEGWWLANLAPDWKKHFTLEKAD